MPDLQKSRLLITGASTGIGRALAEQACRAGARVAIAARSADKLDALAQELGSQGADILAVPGDVTREEDRRRIIQTAVDHFQGLDVLINNAGVGSFGHFVTSSEAVLRQIMEVNFFAPAELMRLAIPHLKQGRDPAIVNVASMCGRRGVPAWTEYSASKFALVGLSEALRGEMARFDIDVLLIVPALTRTDLSENLLRKDGRMTINFMGGMDPAKVARSILRSLRKGRRETVLGLEARWILRCNRLFPWILDRVLIRKVGQLYS